MSSTLKKHGWILFLFPVLSLQWSFPQVMNRYQDQDCLDCHGKPEIHQILEDGRTRSIYVNPEEWAQDVHHKGRMVCVDCHRQASPSLHFREGFKKVDCSRCHPEEAEEYTKNIHFEYRNVSPNKELPQCYDCHTKHFVLLHENPNASIHETNIGDTCGRCHAEVMVKRIFKGTSLGKISGHRKGDLSERFDMDVCITCHYEDSAHGAKRAYKEFCLRCHDVRNKSGGGVVLGPIHLDSTRWAEFNTFGSGLTLVFLLGLTAYIGFRSRRKISRGLKIWMDRMKREEEKEEEKMLEGGEDRKELTAEKTEATAKEEPKE
ncbi:MAG: hypothetical protein PVF22_07205, partial [Candidatus Aminicenantes bacterium]